VRFEMLFNKASTGPIEKTHKEFSVFTFPQLNTLPSGKKGSYCSIYLFNGLNRDCHGI